jgi:hypothetical protein
MSIIVHPPDRRRRDIDNVQKALLDALQHGGAYRLLRSCGLSQLPKDDRWQTPIEPDTLALCHRTAICVWQFSLARCMGSL